MAKRYVDIRMFGDKELQQTLLKLQLRTQKKVVRGALRDGGKVMQQTAKSLAPVKTGTLQKNIKVRSEKVRKRNEFAIQVRTGTRQEMGIAPDDPWYYPAILEYGHEGAPAHPYLRPAYTRNRTRVLRVIEQGLRTRIDQEVRRLATK